MAQTLRANLCKIFTATISVFLLSFVFGVGVSNGQIAAWNMNGLSGDETTVSATSFSSNIVQPVLSRGNGIDPSSLNDAFSSNSFTDSGDKANAISENEYLEFEITPNSGFQVSLSTIDANFRRSSNGPQDFQWLYSLDGFDEDINDIGSEFTYSGTETNGAAQTQIDLSEISELQELGSETTITLRLYGWSAGGTAGTFAIGKLSGNDLEIDGEVELVSEGPVIIRSPSNLSDFAYGEESGPSAEQSFTVEGTNLEDGITIIPPENFEISETSGSGFTNSNITLTESEGSVTQTTIFVRLDTGLSVGSYSGDVTLSSQNADNVTVALSGEVVEAFAIPFFNGLRTEADFDLAVGQGFNFTDAELSTTDGGRIDIDTDGFIETPEIDFTQFDKIRTTFDLRNFGTGSNRELTVKVSNDGGSSFTDVEVIPVDIPEDPYGTFNVDIDVTGANSVSNGMIRFEKTGGTGRIRFRDLFINELTEASVEITGTEGFRMLSTPVEVSLQDFLSPIWTQGITNSDAPNSDNPNIWTWDNNSTGTGTEENLNWDPVSDMDNTLSAGQGALVYVFTDDEFGEDGIWPKTLSVTGTENVLPQSPDINSNAEGFTLVGNPTASALQWSEFNRTQLMDAVWIWDPNGGGGSGAWLSDTGTVGELTDGMIRPFQAFFVRTSDGASSPSLTIPEGARSSGGEFYGKQNQNAPLAVRLFLEGDKLSNSTWLHFTEDGQIGNDAGDAVQFQSLAAEHATLATINSDDNLLDINHLPVQNEEYTIPVHINATIGGSYTLNVTDFDLPGDFELTFNDHTSGTSVPLNSDFTYTIDIEQTAKAKENSNPVEILNRGPVLAKAVNSEAYSITVRPAQSGTIDNPDSELPDHVALEQNYPNPFNPATIINYDIPQQSHVRLAVYDLIGRQVDLLVNETRAAGSYNITWDASQLSSGVYIYRLETAGQTLTRQMTLIK